MISRMHVRTKTIDTQPFLPAILYKPLLRVKLRSILMLPISKKKFFSEKKVHIYIFRRRNESTGFDLRKHLISIEIKPLPSV